MFKCVHEGWQTQDEHKIMHRSPYNGVLPLSPHLPASHHDIKNRSWGGGRQFPNLCNMAKMLMKTDRKWIALCKNILRKFIHVLTWAGCGGSHCSSWIISGNISAASRWYWWSTRGCTIICSFHSCNFVRFCISYC